MPNFLLDGNKIHDASSFYDEISKVCDFPAYFGRNLDALNDCLFNLACSNPGTLYSITWICPNIYLDNNKILGNPPGTILDHLASICVRHGIHLTLR